MTLADLLALGTDAGHVRGRLLESLGLPADLDNDDLLLLSDQELQAARAPWTVDPARLTR